MKIIITESKMINVLERVLDMEYPDLSDSYYDWAEYNCGMGVCCDPYAIGFVLPSKEYNDYLFKLIRDGYNGHGDYPSEFYTELPKICLERPDLTDTSFNRIIIHEEVMITLNEYFNKPNLWLTELNTLLNKKFGFNSNLISGMGWW